ncbi:MAG: biotin/lipoyl-binding protein [Methylibium sp.]|nr:biotin/lipoyl-binding protein [Methylibium sp.]MBA3623584.1 biotin/lipoyl-binding protein [Methylibium sp.]
MNTKTNAVTPLHPIFDLLGRYRAVFAAAWSARRELAGPKRLSDEAAFLPAALSLEETPVHPAPRRAALAVCLFFVIALLWAMFGQIDIVAVAPGRIVVSERTKTLQPLETSVVKRVLVKDGDVVRAGQVLVELDATIARADETSVQEQLGAALATTPIAGAAARATTASTITPARPTTATPTGSSWSG